MVTRELFAAVWKIQPSRSAGWSLAQKRTEITQAMTKALAFMQTSSLRMKATNPVYLFAAPEYYWVKNQAGEKVSLYDQDEKQTIYAAMQGASASLGNIIIFPGTVNWSVDSAGHAGPPTTKQRGLVGYNSAPVFLNGEKLLDYFKKFNDGMLDKEQDGPASFGPGPADGRQSFRANGLHIGLDICGDLNDGKLSQTLAGEKVDVMVLISGTMTHFFNESRLITIPVKEGGAFVHADNSGKLEKNGLWVIKPGGGWHGSHRDENTLAFDDLDHKKRVIGIPKADRVQGNTMTVTAIAGFGPVRDLQATGVVAGGGWIRNFTVVLPGSGREQTAVVEKPSGQDYKVTLSRKFSGNKVRQNLKLGYGDLSGMTATGRGNASKIGKLLPGPDDPDLDCYSVPITSPK